MNLNISQWRSLKTRVTLFTLAIFVISICSLALYVSRSLREDMERQLGEQQFSTVSFVAAEINEGLALRIKTLEKVALSIDQSLLGNPAALQQMLERQVFVDFFNAGVVAVTADGTAVADAPVVSNRRGTNYFNNEATYLALKEGRTVIGRPVLGRVLHEPLFNINAPIRDADGKVIGALFGVINLAKPNFLDRIGENRYGRTGGYLLIAPQQRLIVTATDKSRIMQSLPAPGINPQIDRFVQGYEGYVVYVNAVGVEILNSVSNVPVTGWYLAANLPTAEAFAPIQDMQRRILIATIALTLLAGALTWWMLKRQLAPILTAAKTLAFLQSQNQPPQPLPIARYDEIGVLISGFNSLLGILGKGEEKLRKSKHQYDAMAARIPVGIYLLRSKPDGSFALDYASPRMAEMLNLSVESLVADATIVFQTIHSDDRDSFVKLNQEGIQQLRPFDWIGRVPVGGTLRWLHFTSSPEPQEDGTILWFGLVVDVTERKQMEDQMRQLATYDTLTQLPNRRLLNDRLSQTMAASKRSGCYGALMFLDLDNFKPLNDTHGHGVGDLLLIEAAGRLKSCVRDMDTVARFGGDEFVVMLGELYADKAESTRQAGIIAEKIRLTLAEPYLLTIRTGGKPDMTVEHHCQVSIGVAMYYNHEASQDDIIKWADQAMYRAKEAGRNLVRFYDSNA